MCKRNIVRWLVSIYLIVIAKAAELSQFGNAIAVHVNTHERFDVEHPAPGRVVVKITIVLRAQQPLARFLVV